MDYQDWIDLGYCPIPLLPGEKVCKVPDWQTKNPDDLWIAVNSNVTIGLRCGGSNKLVVIDCDEKNQPGTVDNVLRILHAIGIEPNSYPFISTASGIGRHIYLSLQDELPEGSKKKLDDSIGSGDIRYGTGAYVVAPYSNVNGNEYKLISGDLRELPRIGITDLKLLLGDKIEKPINILPPVTLPQIRHNKQKRIPRLAENILFRNTGNPNVFLR
jgi:hypothetical protein